jgi:hypothetical protein
MAELLLQFCAGPHSNRVRLRNTIHVRPSGSSPRQRRRFERARNEAEMKNKLFLGACLAVGLLAVAAGTVSATPPDPVGCAVLGELPEPDHANKVTLCHFTGSDSNHFIINEVSSSAAASHSDHHGDCSRVSGGSTVCVP